MIAHLAQLLGGPPAPAFLPSFAFNPNILNALQYIPTLDQALSVQGMKEWYISSNPLHPALLFCAVASFLVWVVGELTGKTCFFLLSPPYPWPSHR